MTSYSQRCYSISQIVNYFYRVPKKDGFIDHKLTFRHTAPILTLAKSGQKYLIIKYKNLNKLHCYILPGLKSKFFIRVINVENLKKLGTTEKKSSISDAEPQHRFCQLLIIINHDLTKKINHTNIIPFLELNFFFKQCIFFNFE